MSWPNRTQGWGVGGADGVGGWVRGVGCVSLGKWGRSLGVRGLRLGVWGTGSTSGVGWGGYRLFTWENPIKYPKTIDFHWLSIVVFFLLHCIFSVKGCFFLEKSYYKAYFLPPLYGSSGPYWGKTAAIKAHFKIWNIIFLDFCPAILCIFEIQKFLKLTYPGGYVKSNSPPIG